VAGRRTVKPGCPPPYMPRVKLSAFAENDLARLFNFLAQYDRNTAADAIEVILNSIDRLETSPFLGTMLGERPATRKLVIEFGATGYLVFHEFKVETDTVQVSRVLHQRENYTALSVSGDGP
jgi:plasmid stabilization system protein ParE